MNLDRVIAVRNNKTIYRDGDRCIKVFNKEYSKADVLNEALNQARIEETGLNIPKVLEVTMVDGKWAIVSEFIKGKTLAQLMAEDEERKEEYINLLVDLQILATHYVLLTSILNMTTRNSKSIKKSLISTMLFQKLVVSKSILTLLTDCFTSIQAAQSTRLLLLT